MDEQVLIETRRAWHAVAELVLAGPQHRAAGTIRLRVVPGGFAQVAGPLRVVGGELLGDGVRVPLRGTVAEVAAAAGVEPGAPSGLYSDHAELGVDDALQVDPVAADSLADWLARSERAMLAFAPDARPVLWPEHFDLGIQWDEVNYGCSLGDAGHPLPYAYVGPWTPRSGPFWNAPFGALRPAAALPDAGALTAFFRAGRSAAAA